MKSVHKEPETNSQQAWVSQKLSEQVHTNLQGNFERGWEISCELEKECPDNLAAAFNRGWHYLHKGDLKTGMELIAHGRLIEVFGTPKTYPGKPIVRPNDIIKDKYVLFRGEGGFGDEIINIRFVKYLANRGANVIVSARRELHSLFALNPYISAIIERDKEESLHFDFWVPAMSAVQCVGIESFDQIDGRPYITPPQVFNMPGKFKIGVKWAGDPGFQHERFRRFPKDDFFEYVFKGINADIFSFQKDDLPPENMMPKVTNLGNMLINWANTAQFLSGMDLVISSCTSVAHCAAAMGIPTWIILPILPYYIWALPGETSPFYDSVRLFRQTKFGEWTDIFQYVNNELKQLQEASNA